MKHHFPDFLDAYANYSRDDMCPDRFHYWAGISLVAGALERKVWLIREKHIWFPNLYVMLIGKPAVGKTSVGNAAMTLLRTLGGDDASKQIKFISSQMSEASLTDQIRSSEKTCLMGTEEYKHCSAYFYASEASASLSEINGGGKLTNTLNNFYDCPEFHIKKLRHEDIPVRNACLNMFACSTFAFLDELLPQAVIGGGFASRLLYVVCDEKIIRQPKWDSPPQKDPELFAKLAEDLGRIYELAGQLRPDDSWKQCWEAAIPLTDIEMHSMKSERMQQFVSRRITNTIKLSIVCAAAEGSGLTLSERHWSRASELIAEAEEKLPKIATNTASREISKGIIYHITRILQDEGEDGVLTRVSLYKKLIMAGIDGAHLDATMKQLYELDVVITEDRDRNPMLRRFRLNANPNDYL